jgi:hypothetical protein
MGRGSYMREMGVGREREREKGEVVLTITK